MSSHMLKVLVLLLVVATAVSSASADGTLMNDVGLARFRTNAVAPSVDLTDFLSVYRFDMPMFGAFDVAMFGYHTPLTVANFDGYVGRGDYVNTFMHRSISVAGSGLGVVQGGGFTYSDANGGGYVTTAASVTNEPGLSNVTGTIALAKQGGDPNSGTSQWFFNTADNSTALDTPANNGGFAVFGEVLYDGMDIVGLDNGTGGIANLPVWDASSMHGAFTDLPLSEDYVETNPLTEDDFVRLSSITQVTGQTFQVVGNTNPGLVTPGVAGSTLSLDIAGGASGSVEVTIRTTDGGGQWFDSVLKLDLFLPGDFDGDGDVDSVDVDLIFANITGSGVASRDAGMFDFDGDGDVDYDDMAAVITQLFELPGGG